jgi:Ni,Fe-hydrogenase III component G
MFGITVAGAPDSSRLFLPDQWPEGSYPLRKDFEMEKDKGN